MQIDGDAIVRRGPKPFRFEAMWVEAANCEQVILRSWTSNHEQGGMDDVMRRISVCSENLTKWNKLSFGNVQRQLQQAKTKLQRLQETNPTHLNKDAFKEAHKEVHCWLERNEILCRQRSKALWLKAGDQNTKFFHTKASYRRKNNFISRLKDGEGVWKEGEAKDQLIVHYFQ